MVSVLPILLTNCKGIALDVKKAYCTRLKRIESEPFDKVCMPHCSLLIT